MEQNTINDVWLEAQIDENGIALTLVSEGIGNGTRVEELSHYTFDELQDMSGELFNLNLSDQSREDLSEMGRLSQIGQIYETGKEAGPDLPEAGDVLIDEDAILDETDVRVKVIEVLEDTTADEYFVAKTSSRFDDDTVATTNPSYPEDDIVVKAQYIGGSSKEYAFPLSRLEPAGD